MKIIGRSICAFHPAPSGGFEMPDQDQVPNPDLDLRAADLRGCAVCGGHLVGARTGPFFYVVDVRVAMLDEQAVRRLYGTAEILGGMGKPGAFAIANSLTGGEVLARGTRLAPRVLLCAVCYLEAPGPLALVERVAAQEKRLEQELRARQCDVDGCTGPVFEVRKNITDQGTRDERGLKLCRSHAGDDWEIEPTTTGVSAVRRG
jgi:hypothetical protein